MTVVVTAAIVEQDDRYLITRRVAGTHLEGLWEFPGGKCEPGETPAACLTREIWEELGVEVTVGQEVFSTTHDYSDRRIELHFFQCSLLGSPHARLGQDIQWVARHDLANYEFPPADDELIRKLISTNASPEG